MPRTKGGYTTRRRRKKVLKLAKGFRGDRGNKFKRAKETLLRAGNYAYRDRKARKRDFRVLWIARINAAARMNGISYSQFIAGLKAADIDINRKMLAELAINDMDSFRDLVALVGGGNGQAKAEPAPAEKAAE
jgi:large subunit ribosomal protein L20